jgi:DNA-binding transcriptional MerR regulator
MSMPARSYLSIGEVLGQLRPEFADITISKIRFLEAEGLIHPERTPSGYRKFSTNDVARLRFVLAQQRDNYLPLRVIKEQLDAIDRGLEPPPRAGGVAAVRTPRVVGAAADLPGADAFRPEPAQVRLSRQELLDGSGLEASQLEALENFGLVNTRAKSGYYDGDALEVARAAADMARFGIEPRHLRAYRAAADREIGLFEQVVTPLARQRGADARAKAEETTRELAALSVRLHAALVRAGLRAELGG